ncbi:helix-turn-helix transcriptional regulator [Brevibacillus sp. HD3.3A]|uniref:helix-turn-helix domain-containing protein n=1 Tax=Brevibacillus sp. HD3.3A TaxID=2738979 RepID=UPI00156AB1A5|nr:helix-turn-helix transcriptional regulator [Brevibacillus sp. HD3.3A]UED72104.1 helix-turn-helix domain-containing protein [Brevibacillus sp. HD3.3A]
MSVSDVVEKSSLQKTQIANALNIPLAQLSRYLSGKRPFDMRTLDGITEMLGLSLGYFYTDYLYDCWTAPRNRNLRIRNFLWHTASNGNMEYTRKMVELLIDSGKSLDDLYKVGETFDKSGIKEKALYFYNLVIANERNRLAECLAQSYYRRFMIVREWDLDHAFESATKLGEHIKLLPGKEMYEAFLKIMTVFYVLDKWDHLLKYSKEVRGVMEGAKEYDIDLYVECMSYQEISYRHMRDYDKALEINNIYSKLGEQYRRWSELNRCLIFIEKGDKEAIQHMLILMNLYREDAPNNLEHVLKYYVSNKEFDEIGIVLEKFSDAIQALFSRRDPISQKRSIRVRCFIAEWYISKNDYETAGSLIIESLTQSKSLRLTNQSNECLRILMRIFDEIPQEHKKEIQSLI